MIDISTATNRTSSFPLFRPGTDRGDPRLTAFTQLFFSTLHDKDVK